MSKPRDDRQKDLLLPALDQIIDMSHPLVRLAALIDWNMLNDRFSSVCQAGSGQPWPSDAACRRPVHLEAHAQPVG
jgi:IS5 family transposase